MLGIGREATKKRINDDVYVDGWTTRDQDPWFWDNAVWQVSYARALALSGRFDEAAAAYRQALKIAPRSVAAHAGLAAALLETGHIDEAAVHAAAALALEPNDAPSHNILGAALAIQGRLDEAIAHFKQAIAIDSNYAEARNNLARAERQLEAP